MRGFGVVLLVAALAVGVYALNIDATVPTDTEYIPGYGLVGGNRVNNIGLMDDRRNMLIAAGFMAVVGVGLIVASAKQAGEPIATPAFTDAAALADFTALVRDRGKTGIQLARGDGRTIIETTPGSAAALAGVLPGDRLIAVDGKLPEGDYRQVVMQLVGDAGTTVDISVRRGDERYDFHLVRG